MPLFQAFFTLLLVYLSQLNHALNMPRMREHIKRLNIGHCVLFRQRFQIPRLRSRIAGNINYSFRGNFQKRVQKLSVRSRPCRVEYHGVIMCAELCLLFKKLACVAPVESNVAGKPVFVTVLYCVTDG